MFSTCSIRPPSSLANDSVLYRAGPARGHGSFPATHDDVTAWAWVNHTTAEVAYERFVQSCILAEVAASPWLGKTFVLRGGSALSLFGGFDRRSRDLDFIALDLVKGRDAAWRERLRGKLCRLITRALRKRVPDFHARRERLRQVVKVHVSPHIKVCDVERRELLPGLSVQVVSVEDSLAEKLIAVQSVRWGKPPRPQDVYDLACHFARDVSPGRLARVRRNVFEMAAARKDVPIGSPSAWLVDDVIRDAIGRAYPSRVVPLAGLRYVPFDRAWHTVRSAITAMFCQDEPSASVRTISSPPGVP